MRYSSKDVAYLERKGADALKDRVQPDNLWAWNAYHTLRASRQVGFGVSPIPISEISAYCDFTGINDQTQKMRLVRIIAKLDRAERNYGNTSS